MTESLLTKHIKYANVPIMMLLYLIVAAFTVPATHLVVSMVTIFLLAILTLKARPTIPYLHTDENSSQHNSNTDLGNVAINIYASLCLTMIAALIFNLTFAGSEIVLSAIFTTIFSYSWVFWHYIETP